MMTAEDVREKSGVESKAEISGTDGNEGKGNGRGSYCGESDYRESDGREHGGEGNSNGGSGKENPENKCASIEIYFWAVAEEWLAKVRFARKTSTYIKYWLIYKNYLEKHFRNMEISLVTDRTVQEKSCFFIGKHWKECLLCAEPDSKICIGKIRFTVNAAETANTIYAEKDCGDIFQKRTI